jgi:hypothetical protein
MKNNKKKYFKTAPLMCFLHPDTSSKLHFLVENGLWGTREVAEHHLGNSIKKAPPLKGLDFFLSLDISI